MRSKGGVIMKSDKELTIEVVTVFIESWNSRNGTKAMQPDDVFDFIKAVYSIISSLTSNDPDADEK
jgi:hypothetical protein